MCLSRAKLLAILQTICFPMDFPMDFLIEWVVFGVLLSIDEAHVRLIIYFWAHHDFIIQIAYLARKTQLEFLKCYKRAGALASCHGPQIDISCWCRSECIRECNWMRLSIELLMCFLQSIDHFLCLSAEALFSGTTIGLILLADGLSGNIISCYVLS